MRFFVYSGSMREPLCELLKACGGEISGSVHGSIPIRYAAGQDDAGHSIKSVYSHRWVLNSIQSGSLQPLADYLLEAPSSDKKKGSATKAHVKRTPARHVATAIASAGSSVSSPDFTEDMDQAILRLAKRNARELEAEPQSPVFWRKALKMLGFTECTWEDVRDRYLSVLCDTGEEDHQSGSSEGEEEVEENELAQQSVAASESKLMKFLTASSTKPRIASRRLANKAESGGGAVAPQVVDVRKNLMNGSKGHQVFGDAVPHPPPPLEEVVVVAPPSSKGPMGPLPQGLSAEDMVARLARETGCSHKVALHGLLVCGGNAGKARRYLRGGGGSGSGLRPWTVEEDALVRQATEGGGAAEAVRLLSRTRTQTEIIARCKWMVAPAKPAPAELELEGRAPSFVAGSGGGGSFATYGNFNDELF